MSIMSCFRKFWVGAIAASFPLIAVAGSAVSQTGEGESVNPQPALNLTVNVQAAPAVGGSSTQSPTSKPRDSFIMVKNRADKVTSALDGVVHWQTFVESGVTGDDLAKGEAELKVWQERVDDDASIINKKWVGGKDKKNIEERVRLLIDEYSALAKKSQTLEGIKKLEEAKKVWPENFSIQFYLGSIALDKRDIKEAIQYFENCNRLNNSSAAVLNNLGSALVIQRQYDRGLQLLTRSVRITDTKENVQNLISALASLPGNSGKASKYKDARDAANLLNDKHKISGPAQQFLLMRLDQDRGDSELAKKEVKPGEVVGSGSGFLISSDGLILTNKHVAAMGKGVMIKFTDGTQRVGEIVVVDDEADLALIRIKSETPLPFVKLAKYDNPPDGSKAIVMGYPAPTLFGYSVKTTSGPVAAGNNEGFTSDVTLDVRVNPGNSGGPVYDEFGNIMAIIAQKTNAQAGANLDTYGLAISNGRIRRFLSKNNITVEAAESTSGTPLTIQQVTEKNKLATVCILGTG